MTASPSSSSSRPRSIDLLQVVEPVDVEVQERHVAFVLTHDRERRAHDRLGHAEAAARYPSRAPSCRRRGRRRARPRRPPGAAQPTRVAPARPRLASPTPSTSAQHRSLRRRGAPRGRASRSTKSARAWARAGPPLRSTADGCSAGMRTASVAERELLAPQLRDPLLGVEQQLGGEVAERDDDRRAR